MSADAPGQERIVVGYVPEYRGNEALEFACFLATGVETEVFITMVLPEGRAGDVPRRQLDEWRDEALGRVRDRVRARVDFRRASSDARGLLDAAQEHQASMIVIGATAGPIMRKFTVGSVANVLLHASPVPVALAPDHYRASEGGVTRLTGIYGTRPGSEAVIGRTVQRAIARNIPARLISLVQVDLIDPREIRDVSDEAREFGGRVLESEALGMLESGRASIEVAEGRDIEDALRQVEWRRDEIAVLGSSRLGGGRSVFLGTRARRIMRILPVPVIVIPSDYRGPDA